MMKRLPLFDEESDNHIEKPKIRMESVIQCNNELPPCIREAMWEEAISDPEYKCKETRREQLAWLFEHFKDDHSFNHTDIAQKFGITRQAAEKQVKKAIHGTKEPHRPSISIYHR